MRKKKTSFPSNPFPYIINYDGNLYNTFNYTRLTPKQKDIISYLKKGAILILDVSLKKVLVYEFKKGLHLITKLSIRMLSSLLRMGYIKVGNLDSGKVFFDLAV